MMYTWSPYPFLRITFAFILGILIQHFYNVQINTIHALIAVLCLFILFIIIKFLLKSYNFLIGNLGLVLILFTGFMNATLYDQSNDPNHLIHNKTKISGYSAKVKSSFIEKEKYFIYDIELKNALLKDSVIQSSGIVKLYVRRKNIQSSILEYGDEIFVKANPFRLPPPGNPNEFNYMKYMAGQNIYFQQFVDDTQILILDNKPSNYLMAWAIKWRNYFSQKIDDYIFSPHEAAIAKALILGVKDGLDNKIKASYASAGAMHVLAVSGLHAGIIHLILQWLFKPLIKRKVWKYLLPTLSIAFLWCFAMITGLSPSIMRAVTMFSIIIIGDHFFSKPNIFNSLALSAFILLFYNPNFLFSVGFQLSYIAVLGIIYLFPLIYNIISLESKILDHVWSITSVSIAAQIATFPLTLYYFHQFPTYFLISNLIVIPAAFIIMSLGIALLLSPIFFISDFIGFLLETLISKLNWFVFYIQNLDMSLIEWLYIDEIQAIAIYLLILSFLMLIHYRKMKFMKIMLGCSLIISLSGCYNIYQQHISKKLIFYDIKNQSIVDQVNGFNTQLSAIHEIDNIELVKHQIDPFRLAHNLTQVSEKSLNNINASNKIDGVKVMNWHNRKIIFITKQIENLVTTSIINCDILVLSNNSVRHLKDINTIFNYGEIVIDNTNNYFTRKSIIKEANKLKIICRSIEDTGAIIFEN